MQRCYPKPASGSDQHMSSNQSSIEPMSRLQLSSRVLYELMCMLAELPRW